MRKKKELKFEVLKKGAWLKCVKEKRTIIYILQNGKKAM